MNVPIPPPQLNSLARYVTRPRQSQYPPTDDDVIAAFDLTEQVGTVMGNHPGINRRDWATVLRYETAIRTQAHEQNYPPPVEQGVAQAIAAALAPFQQQIQQQIQQMEQQMHAGFNDIRNQLTRIEGDLVRTTRITARATNRNIGRGELARLEVVPFPNNTYPASVDPPLPPLQSVDDVLNLNTQDLRRYLENYYPGEPIPHLLNDRKTRLLVAVGCRIFPNLFEAA